MENERETPEQRETRRRLFNRGLEARRAGKLPPIHTQVEMGKSTDQHKTVFATIDGHPSFIAGWMAGA